LKNGGSLNIDQLLDVVSSLEDAVDSIKSDGEVEHPDETHEYADMPETGIDANNNHGQPAETGHAPSGNSMHQLFSQLIPILEKFLSHSSDDGGKAGGGQSHNNANAAPANGAHPGSDNGDGGIAGGMGELLNQLQALIEAIKSSMAGNSGRSTDIAARAMSEQGMGSSAYSYSNAEVSAEVDQMKESIAGGGNAAANDY